MGVLVMANSIAQSPFATESEGIVHGIDEEGFWKPSFSLLPPMPAATTLDKIPDMVDFAQQFIGTRYRSGGKGPAGFDCSGFTSYIFKNFGLSLASSSRQQYTQGESVDIKDLQPGDLMFFGGRSGGKRVGHVGMVVDVDSESNSVKFIHAACKSGITVSTYPDDKYYAKRYIGSRRVLN